MKKILLLLLTSLFVTTFSQTYQLTGNPVNTTGWTLANNAVVNTDFVQLTEDVTTQVGAIRLNNPINLKYCDKWRVEFDFRIDGNGTSTFGRGDGFSFWYIANPPTTYGGGGGLGLPNNAVGFMTAFDIFNNTTEGQMSKVHILYGVSAGNIEYNNTPGSTFHSTDLNPTIPFVNTNYRHVIVTGEVDPANSANWIIKITIDNTLVVNQSFAPSGAAATMGPGYFGFSAATGGASARHSIKNVEIYIDKVPVLTNTITPTNIPCPDLSTGMTTVDLTSYNSSFLNNPSNYNISYFEAGSSTPIANPSAYTFSGNKNIEVLISDPTDLYCDNPDVVISLSTASTPPVEDLTIGGCQKDGGGIGVFNLTAANVSGVPNITKEYYVTLNDLLNGTSPITDPQAYEVAAPSTVYVKVIDNDTNCAAYATVNLEYFPTPEVFDAELLSCANPVQENLGTFYLTAAVMTYESSVTYRYFPTKNDAVEETNEIIPLAIGYISPSTTIYAKIFNNRGCGAIAKLNLKVVPPKRSPLLKDVFICIEDRATLDAGPGYDKYEWSTGEETASITASIGSYYVDLYHDYCITRQYVNVYKAPEIIVKEIEITNNQATIIVEGGKAPYQYSLDGANWQDSNVFSGLERGDNTIYVKDVYDCEPTILTFTVPNLINVITPNGDGHNEGLDYSALANKPNFLMEIYDRYGNKINTMDRSKSFRWDGKNNGREIVTDTYWYHISWNEPNLSNTLLKFSGWILVKNR